MLLPFYYVFVSLVIMRERLFEYPRLNTDFVN